MIVIDIIKGRVQIVRRGLFIISGLRVVDLDFDYRIFVCYGLDWVYVWLGGFQYYMF